MSQDEIHIFYKCRRVAPIMRTATARLLDAGTQHKHFHYTMS